SFQASEGALADPVARGIVVAGDDHAAGEALNPGATHRLGAVPHDLREVAAHLPRHARVVARVIVHVLPGPVPHRVRHPPVPPRPPEHVLAVGPHRVHDGAVGPPLLRPALRVPCQIVVPLERLLAGQGPHLVMRMQELPHHVLPPILSAVPALRNGRWTCGVGAAVMADADVHAIGAWSRRGLRHFDGRKLLLLGGERSNEEEDEEDNRHRTRH
ncbi:unnamed protein product, partial [Musa acuminata subsp. malaccensis]